MVEHLIEDYQGNEIFILNDNEVKVGLKDVALISGLEVVKTDFRLTMTSQPTLGVGFSRELRKLLMKKSIKPPSVVHSLGMLTRGTKDRVCLTMISR